MERGAESDVETDRGGLRQRLNGTSYYLTVFVRDRRGGLRQKNASGIMGTPCGGRNIWQLRQKPPQLFCAEKSMDSAAPLPQDSRQQEDFVC